MNDFKFIGNHIELAELPKKLKKMTATKFASVLGLNAWSTPFQQWCEITKTYNMPFEDTKYTLAGKAIEPIIIKYLQDVYFMDIKTPADIYGEDYFSKTYGDFYPDVEVFGGMWDVKGDDVIVEIKTTSRPQDWLEGIPIYYKLQAGLYAHLSGIDNVYVVCAFLNDEDYAHPEAFKPNASNTMVRSFSMKEDFPNFKEDYIIPALDWWDMYVTRGISPNFDEKADAEYLKALRTTVIDSDASLDALLKLIDEEQKALEEAKAQYASTEKELKKHKEALKKYMMSKFKPSDEYVKASSSNYTFTLSKTEKEELDKTAMKNDGILEKYTVLKTSYTLRDSKNK